MQPWKLRLGSCTTAAIGLFIVLADSGDPKQAWRGSARRPSRGFVLKDDCVYNLVSQGLQCSSNLLSA